MKKKNYIVSKEYVIYANKDLVLVIIIKNIIKLEIIVIKREDLAELLMTFEI